MKVTPIIMSSPMVGALLEGRKTMTRRIIKPQPSIVPDWSCPGKDGIRFKWATYALDMLGQFMAQIVEKCPYGKPGESLLWVRENGWQRPERTERMMRDGADTWPPFEYDANDCMSDESLKEWGWKRRPSIYMPRWASRLTLELSGVRVERLQDITEEDAIAEGIEPVFTGAKERCGWLDYQHAGAGVGYFPNPIDSYHSLFRSLHGDDIVAKNPWLWALNFVPHRQNIDTFLKTREVAA